MALLFWDGFDSYNSLSDLVTAKSYVNPGYMVAYGSYPDFQNSEGRFGGRSFGGGYWCWWGLIDISSFSTTTELYTGRAVKLPANEGLIAFWGNNGGGTNIPDVWIMAESGAVAAYYFDATNNSHEIGRANNVFAFNTWHYIEARCKMSSSNTTSDGIVEVWLNNVKIISNTACIAKRINSTTAWQGVNFSSATVTNGGQWRNDDIYVTDTNGSAPWNGRLGDSRIQNLPVIADAGPNDGTVANGSAHYLWVNDTIGWNSNYVTLSGSGNSEVYTVNSVSSNVAQIYAVAVTSIANKTDAGAQNVHSILVSNGATYNGSTISLSTSFNWNRSVYTTNPNTGSQWTVAQVSNTKIGLMVE